MTGEIVFRTAFKAFCIGFLVPLTGLAAGYDTRDFGNRVPSTEEFIQALKPDQPAGVKYRGLKPVESSVTKPKAVSVESVQFAFDSHELTDRAKEVLNNLGAAIKSEDLGQYSFVIEGHTDSVGSRGYNRELSERRARAVKSYLVSRFGIESARLETVGKGEDELFDKANPESGVNRRVQIINAGS